MHFYKQQISLHLHNSQQDLWVGTLMEKAVLKCFTTISGVQYVMMTGT